MTGTALIALMMNETLVTHLLLYDGLIVEIRYWYENAVTDLYHCKP